MYINIIKLIDEQKKKLRIETKKAIYIFNNILENNFADFDLDNWKNNLSNLKIGYGLCKLNEAGHYEIISNTIYLRKIEYVKYLYHELFHVASSYITKNGVSCGFMLVEGNSIIGYGLNEGYTQLLTERYIDEKLDKYSLYKIERYFALMLEKIIGQKQMESLYLNGNLAGLINILLNYANEDEIRDFLIEIDDINDGILDIDSIAHLNRLLLSWYIKKNKIGLEKDKITEKEYKDNILNFYKDIGDFSDFKVKIKK